MIATPRDDLPPHIEKRLAAWRRGLERLPPSYIEHHQNVALANLARLVFNFGVRISAHHRLVPSQWMDGMALVRVVVQNKAGRTLLLQWQDEGAGGCFFVDTGRGRHRLTPEDLLRGPENRPDPPQVAALAA